MDSRAGSEPLVTSLNSVSGDNRGLQTSISEHSTPPTLKHTHQPLRETPTRSWAASGGGGTQIEKGAYQHALEKSFIQADEKNIVEK